MRFFLSNWFQVLFCVYCGFVNAKNENEWIKNVYAIEMGPWKFLAFALKYLHQIGMKISNARNRSCPISNEGNMIHLLKFNVEYCVYNINYMPSQHFWVISQMWLCMRFWRSICYLSKHMFSIYSYLYFYLRLLCTISIIYLAQYKIRIRFSYFIFFLFVHKIIKTQRIDQMHAYTRTSDVPCYMPQFLNKHAYIMHIFTFPMLRLLHIF